MSDAPTVYMAGPITHAPDHGHDWREAIQQDYPEVDWLNPLDQYDAHASEVEVVYTGEYIDEGDRVSTRAIVEHDKALIRQSDAVLCYWPGYQSDGTAMELCYADESGVPVVVWSEDAPADLSIWIYEHAFDVLPTRASAVDVTRIVAGEEVLD